MLYWSIMQKSTCSYLKKQNFIYLSCIWVWASTSLKCINFFPLLTLLGQCTSLPWQRYGQWHTCTQESHNFNYTVAKQRQIWGVQSSAKRKSKVQQNLLMVFSALEPTDCIFFLPKGLWVAMGPLEPQSFTRTSNKFLISHGNPLFYSSLLCSGYRHLLIYDILGGSGRETTDYSSLSQTLCFYKSWCISKPVVLY